MCPFIRIGVVIVIHVVFIVAPSCVAVAARGWASVGPGSPGFGLMRPGSDRRLAFPSPRQGQGEAGSAVPAFRTVHRFRPAEFSK